MGDYEKMPARIRGCAGLNKDFAMQSPGPAQCEVILWVKNTLAGDTTFKSLGKKSCKEWNRPIYASW